MRKLNGDSYDEIVGTQHTFTRVGTYEMSMLVSITNSYQHQVVSDEISFLVHI